MPPSPDRLPDYHFLLISSNLGAEWFFDAARQYWERFRPLVVSDLELARLIPPELNTIVTVVARRDVAAQWGVSMAQVTPNALFDPVVQDYFEEMRAQLDERVALNMPFGVPLIPTPMPPTPISPTPGAIIIGDPVATREPGGFITATPTPALDGAVQPLPSPTVAAPTSPESTPAPLYPTPGPITGGG